VSEGTITIDMAGESVTLTLRPAPWDLVQDLVCGWAACEQALVKIGALERALLYGEATAQVVAALADISGRSVPADGAMIDAAIGLLGRSASREGLGEDLADLAGERLAIGRRMERLALGAFDRHVSAWDRNVKLTRENVEALFRVDPDALWGFLRSMLQAERVDDSALGESPGAWRRSSGSPGPQPLPASPAAGGSTPMVSPSDATALVSV